MIVGPIARLYCLRTLPLCKQFHFSTFKLFFMKHLTKTWLILELILSFLVVSCKKDMLSEANTLSNQQDDRSAQDMLSDRMKLSNEVIIDWSNLAYESSGGYLEGHPLLATRIKAMMHIAMHDALNAIVPVYQSYAYHPQEKFHLANPVAACASAAYTVLMASYPIVQHCLMHSFLNPCLIFRTDLPK